MSQCIRHEMGLTSTYLDIPLRPLEKGHSVLDLLASDIGVLLKCLLLGL